MGKKRILDIGCGKKRKIKNAIGIDRIKDIKPDIVVDVDKDSLPFKDNTFDLIVCNHIIEHISEPIKFMEEIHRIAKNGAVVKGFTPHFSNPCSFADPTHKHHLSVHFFDFFAIKKKRKRGFLRKLLNKIFEFEFVSPIEYYSEVRFKEIKIALTFLKFYRKTKIIPFFANRYPDFYENYFSGIFRAGDIYFELKVIKNGK